MALYWFLMCAVHAASLAAGYRVDLTVTPGSKGKAVVESVVDRIRSNCIFPDDRMFLRRLAYVESHDGNDQKTYRKDYHGGIWQVDESRFVAIRRCPFIIKDECDTIKTAFNIDWSSTQWEDLRKPLYSGLAASLYMLLRLGFLGSIPGEIGSQADTWSHYYHLGRPDSDFVAAAMSVQEDCKGKLDLVFVVDSSGSINFPDYITMLIFIQNVTRHLDFGPDGAQAAAVVYGTHASVAYHFDTYQTKAGVLDAIAHMDKDNGGTNTSGAIDLATDQVFSKSRGAREGVSKVMIVLTDGASNDYNNTVDSALRAKQHGIIVFTVGIGSVNRLELESVASDPSCTHMFVLKYFSEIESILNELRKGSCQAPKVLTEHTTGSNSAFNGTQGTTSITETFNGTLTSTIKISNMWTFVNGTNNIVKAEVNCGVLDIYSSFETPNPGPAFFEVKQTAKDGSPAILDLVDSHNGRPMYITAIATQLPPIPGNTEKCRNPKYTVSLTKKLAVTIVCEEGGTLRACTKLDYIHAELTDLLCEQSHKTEVGLANPCTHDNLKKGLLLQPYALDSSKFIRCDLAGRMYVTACPGHDIFNKETLSCGFHSVAVVNGGTALSSTIPNPCTPERILKQEYFFAFPGEAHSYVHCDVWGGAWVQRCRLHFLWNDVAKTCVEDFFHEFDSSTPKPIDIHNPCQVGSSLMFYPHPDQSKFIHCDVAGNYWVQSCPPGLRWDSAAHACVRGGN